MSFFLAELPTVVAVASESATTAREMPELASMALLSVVLAGISIAVRRVVPRSARKPRVETRPSPADAPATPTPPARSQPSGS